MDSMTVLLEYVTKSNDCITEVCCLGIPTWVKIAVC